MSTWSARLLQIYHKLDRHTGGLPRILKRTIVSYGRDEGPALAASIAYYALFSFFPLALFLLAISSNLVNSAEAQEQVVSFVESFLPTAGELVRNNVAAILRMRGAVGTLAALGLLWSASSVFTAVDRAINRAWGATTHRSFWRQKALSLVMVLGIGLLFFLSNLTTTAYNLLNSIRLPWVDIELFNNHLGRQLLPLLGPALLDYAVFWALYRLLPVVRVRWQDVLPGALVAGTAWQVAKAGFNLYLRSFARYNLVYGSVTAIIVFLVLTYIAAVILVMGAEFAAAWTYIRRERKSPTVWDEKHLSRWIAENGVAAEVICLPVETPTVQAAARAVNVSPAAILKSLVFLADGQPHLVMANGLGKVDRGKLAARWSMGKKRIKMASAQKVLELTGYPIGAVPPFGHRTPLPALMDPSVLEQPVVYAGGGGIQALVRLTSDELIRVVGPEIVSVVATADR
ncbi:MAG: YihY family inner membrane protein [Anaerolineae bacterium]|nr:MAG: YihY family inner membrane protein [Anaerolineae bacterium]